MFFPQEMTLGYSHGLVLYAPIYAPLRAFFHPFQAYNLTLFVVMVLGTISLYALLRIHFRLTFVESVLFTAFFATSANIINGGIECGYARSSSVTDRLGFYARFTSLLGVSEGANLDCDAMDPY